MGGSRRGLYDPHSQSALAAIHAELATMSNADLKTYYQQRWRCCELSLHLPLPKHFQEMVQAWRELHLRRKKTGFSKWGIDRARSRGEP